jgi:hypothetical protein
MFAQLVAYKEIHGDCNVLMVSGPLGRWCVKQRGRKSKLSPDRITRLEAIGFCWDLDATAWEQKFAELVAYKKVHCHCNVPQDHPLEDWISNQRCRKAKLSPEQIARLDAEGFWWDVVTDTWEKMFAELVTYKKVHGHCNVPQGNGPLGTWVGNQRCRKDRLRREWIERLNAEGFSWDPLSEAWEKMFDELVAFKKANGHCNVPPSNRLLALWCTHQRSQYIKNKLSSDRVARLEALAFCWDLKAARWNERIAELIAFKKANGHCNVPQDGSPLGGWVCNLRQFYKKNRLSLERIAQLTALGFCWNPPRGPRVEPAYKAAA